MAAQNNNHRYSKRNLVRTEGFDKKLNWSVNHRPMVSPTLTFMNRIPNDVRRTGKPSRKKPKRHIEREKGEETGGGDKAWNSEKQSSRSLLQFPSHRQEELKKIYGKRTERNVEVTFGSERKRLKGRIEREKDEETGGGDKAWNSEKQSSRSHRQEELRKIYGKRIKRNVNVTFGSEDSESSEEEEGISEEEFKRTEGWKLFKEALDAHTKCNNSAKK